MKFVTWAPETWESVAFDRISFPAAQNPLSIKPNIMLLLFFSSLAPQVYERLGRTERSVDCNFQRAAHKEESAESPFQRTPCVYLTLLQLSNSGARNLSAS
jgi:hypothetical protein